MPVYLVKDPKTGQSVKLTGDSPPTEQELNDIFANLPAQQEQSSFSDQALGVAENIGSLVGSVFVPFETSAAADEADRECLGGRRFFNKQQQDVYVSITSAQN